MSNSLTTKTLADVTFLPAEGEKSPQELFPCAHAENISVMDTSKLSIASLSDDFKCHRTDEVYQYGLCKNCLREQFKKLRHIIDEVRK